MQRPPIVLRHNNPSLSYLKRNVMPHNRGLGSLIACGLIGMGISDRLPDSGSETLGDNAITDKRDHRQAQSRTSANWITTASIAWNYGRPPRSAIRRIAAMLTSFLKWNCSPQRIGVTLRYTCIPSIPYPGWSYLRSEARAFRFAPWSSNRRVNAASGSCPRWFIQIFGCDTTLAKRGV